MLHIYIMLLLEIKDKIWLPFSFIILLAIFFRVYALDSVPPSSSLDEVSIGYNAFSIIQTGKDEFSNVLPFLLRAYDDWRPGLYVYLVIPFLTFLDVSTVAVRMPSVILSLVSLIATYFITLEIFKSKAVALLTIFFLSISPWHIYLSRLGHEANLGFCLVVLGMLFFLKGINTKKTLLFFTISSIFFALSIGSYQSQKITVPAILCLLALVFSKQLIKKRKEVCIAVSIGILFLLPTIYTFFSPETLIRFKATNALSEENPMYFERAKLLLEAKQTNDILGQVYYNRRFTPFVISANNYLSHFSYEWLTSNSGNERHKVPNMGLLYKWEIVLFLIGIIVIIKSKILLQFKLFLAIWLLTAPLSAAITTDAPHAMRAFTSVPIWQMLAGYSLTTIFVYLKNKKISYIPLLIACIFIVSASMHTLYNQYFITFPKEQSDSFQYPLYKAIQYVKKHEKAYEQIVFSNENALMQSYMFFLFHTKFDPYIYLREGGTISGGFAESHYFNKYAFSSSLDTFDKSKKTLIISNANEKLEYRQIKSINNLKNEKKIIIWEK